MKIAIFHYASFLKGSYSTVEYPPTATLEEVIAPWKPYFKNPNLRVWKFKHGRWAEPYNGNHTDSFFDNSTTIQEYRDFYPDALPYVTLILC